MVSHAIDLNGYVSRRWALPAAVSYERSAAILLAISPCCRPQTVVPIRGPILVRPLPIMWLRWLTKLDTWTFIHHATPSGGAMSTKPHVRTIV